MKYIFGGIRVDADARVISRGTAAVHLTRKAFALLVMLLERRPNAVSKEQIHEQLWPNAFVTESSLQTLVREIRQAIDDPRSSQSWIRTVHGVGYSFAGDAVVDHAEPHEPQLKRPMAWLIGESTRVALRAGENVLGRGSGDVIEIDLPTISRRHARITIADAVIVEDLGSKNGTWLHNERLTQAHVLADGDIVRLGSVSFTFRLPRPSPSTESAEMPPAGDDVAPS